LALTRGQALTLHLRLTGRPDHPRRSLDLFLVLGVSFTNLPGSSLNVLILLRISFADLRRPGLNFFLVLRVPLAHESATGLNGWLLVGIGLLGRRTKLRLRWGSRGGRRGR